jgi:hypothetical protein
MLQNSASLKIHLISNIKKKKRKTQIVVTAKLIKIKINLIFFCEVTENSQEQAKTQNYSFQWNAHLRH